MNDQNDSQPAEPTEEDLAMQRAIDEEELDLAEIDAEENSDPVKLPATLSALEQAGAQAYLQKGNTIGGPAIVLSLDEAKRLRQDLVYARQQAQQYSDEAQRLRRRLGAQKAASTRARAAIQDLERKLRA